MFKTGGGNCSMVGGPQVRPTYSVYALPVHSGDQELAFWERTSPKVARCVVAHRGKRSEAPRANIQFLGWLEMAGGRKGTPFFFSPHALSLAEVSSRYWKGGYKFRV